MRGDRAAYLPLTAAMTLGESHDYALTTMCVGEGQGLATPLAMP